MDTPFFIRFPERLEAERIYVRPYCPSDAPSYFAIAVRNHQHLAAFESGNAAFSLQTETEAENLLREFQDQWTNRKAFYLGVFHKSDKTFVGQVYVGVTNAMLPEFTIGFFADVSHQHQGYITEAVRRVLQCLFQDLRAHRVTLWCDERNEPSWRLAERCGFRREGHLRENKRGPDGAFSGSFCYALLCHDPAIRSDAPRPSASACEHEGTEY